MRCRQHEIAKEKDKKETSGEKLDPWRQVSGGEKAFHNSRKDKQRDAAENKLDSFSAPLN